MSRFVSSAPTCPHCCALLDGASAADGDENGRGPEPGDPTVCAYCAEMSLFDGDPLQLRVATADELAELSSDPELARVLAYFRRLRDAGQLQPPPPKVTH